MLLLKITRIASCLTVTCSPPPHVGNFLYTFASSHISDCSLSKHWCWSCLDYSTHFLNLFGFPSISSHIFHTNLLSRTFISFVCISFHHIPLFIFHLPSSCVTDYFVTHNTQEIILLPFSQLLSVVSSFPKVIDSGDIVLDTTQCLQCTSLTFFLFSSTSSFFSWWQQTS